MTPGFTALPDLAARDLAAGVVFATDEFFAERENLIKPGPAVFSAADFGHKGKTYDGWETRRRREPGADHAIVRLGVPGVVSGVIIDTAWFKGNYPPEASVEATSAEGYPSPAELRRATWETLVGRSPIEGDTENAFPVADPRRFTHVRLTIYPDGGVARFRVHGEPVPDPRLMDGTVDLAALESGGDVVDCSDIFYSSPRNILLPGRSRLMGDGWENARRRDDGNDHVTVALAGHAHVHRVEIDTSYYLGNAPGWASLKGMDGDAQADLLPKTRLQPDTRHHFRAAATAPVTHVRLDVYPDGGIARLRVHGTLTREARAAAAIRFLDLLPEDHATTVLTTSGGLAPGEARTLLAARPFGDGGAPPARVLEGLLVAPSAR
ncbi:allantoicase [Actinomadura sp. 7K507]|uniref:allantoicase n=1 Tax=Actinomadura sp. 7K507 TaxID=2530365 RepID=UPI001042D9DC|nr:allantoicase [Actinomadura sp. 7K507]TDC97184.1 allantoicase [Actinomadura sp. 7K507]